jgi:phosphoribosylamine--glycine ligase
VRLLLVGGGGREHALAWKFRNDDPTTEIIAAPGNPGIAEVARCGPVGATSVPALVDLARDIQADVVMVGPEAPLGLGLVDRLREQGIAAFGPTAFASQIETSKRFAKELMLDAGVPTAQATSHADAASAKRAAHALGAPVVIKASGLAAGKGVIIANDVADAERAIDAMLVDGAFGDAGSEVLVEEFMTGEELSCFVITDGERWVPMLPVQDHKRLLAGDRGPNTGGMGAYAPVTPGTPELIAEVGETIIAPTLAALRDRGAPFTGLLYAGLMLTPSGPRVVEFNCRFGDPETEALLPLLDSSLLDLVASVARGERLDPAARLAWRPAHAVTTVVAAAGYPDKVRTGDPIEIPAAPADPIVFHAGTSRDAQGRLVTSGGRVLTVTSLGPSLADAQKRSAAFAASVRFEGRQYRDDIGWRELSRAGAT